MIKLLDDKASNVNNNLVFTFNNLQQEVKLRFSKTQLLELLKFVNHQVNNITLVDLDQVAYVECLWMHQYVDITIRDCEDNYFNNSFTMYDLEVEDFANQLQQYLNSND